MAVPAINAPETAEQSKLLGSRNILMNQEVGSSCRLTDVCKASCFLAWSHANAGPALPPQDLVSAALEIFGHSEAQRIRHWALVAKEPLQNAESVRTIAAAWHDAAPDLRPGTIGTFTAYAAGLTSQAKTWRSTPLSWVMTSADVESASLHPVKNGAALMEAATQAKDIGGVLATCVNTTVGNTDLESLFNIGRMADRLGFNQWSIGGLYKPCGPRMEDSLTEVQCREVLTAITREFEKSNLQIAVSVTPEIFQKWATESVPTPMSTAWRLERKISRNVTLIAPNLQRGFFLRLRWDGQLMDLNDVLTLSLKTGSFGTFRPGSVRRIIGSLPELQGRTHQENTFAKAA